MSKKIVVPRLAEKYHKEVVPALLKEFKYENAMRIPKLKKVVVNIGCKEGQEDIKLLDQLIAPIMKE